MSKLSDMIEALCPDGVEYVRLGELLKNKNISTITPSVKITKHAGSKNGKFSKTGKTPIISQEIEYISGYCDVEDPRIQDGEYLCYGDHTEYFKYVDFAFVQGADGLKILKVNDENILTKFIYYALQNNYVRQNNYRRHFTFLVETEIPLPPLPIQQEIVRILDTFTQLQTELQTELQLRKKQYNYYREQLLTFRPKQ